MKIINKKTNINKNKWKIFKIINRLKIFKEIRYKPCNYLI